MTKKTKEKQKLYFRDKYKNIIMLIEAFQYPEYRGEQNTDTINGIELMHIRRALQKNFKYPDNWTKGDKQKDIENFYGDKLDTFFKKTGAEKIDAKESAISMRLQELVRAHALKKKRTKHNSYRYMLDSLSLEGDFDKKRLNEIIDYFPTETIRTLGKRDEPAPTPYLHINAWACMLGMPKDFLGSWRVEPTLSEIESKEMYKKMWQVIKLVDEINAMLNVKLAKLKREKTDFAFFVATEGY